MCLEQFNTIIIDTFFVFWRPNFLFYSLLFINIGFEKLAMVATLQYPVIINSNVVRTVVFYCSQFPRDRGKI